MEGGSEGWSEGGMEGVREGVKEGGVREGESWEDSLGFNDRHRK